jgi:hypothetical protein
MRAALLIALLPIIIVSPNNRSTSEYGRERLSSAGQYYGFILITFTNIQGSTLQQRVSGVIGYCEAVGASIGNSLKIRAEGDADRVQFTNQVIRPANTARRQVQFFGGSSTAAQAQKDIDFWVGLGAKRYSSTMEGGNYYPQSVCSGP